MSQLKHLNNHIRSQMLVQNCFTLSGSLYLVFGQMHKFKITSPGSPKGTRTIPSKEISFVYHIFFMAQRACTETHRFKTWLLFHKQDNTEGLLMHPLRKHHCTYVAAFTTTVMEKDCSPRFGENNCFLRQFPCKGCWSSESLC